MPEVPEPLIDFSTAARPLAERLQRLDDSKRRYETELQAGRIARNSIEAMRVELTYHSNAIEGNTLSLRETQLVLEGISPPGAKTLREIYEARNHDAAFETIESWIAERSPIEPLTLQDALDIHRIVMRDIDPATGGLRPGRVLIKGTPFVPPGSQRFDSLIPHMLELANSDREIHPVLRAAELHYDFVAIHPFVDGNGRTARLLMNFLLMRLGYPITIIDVADRAEYLMVLEHANKGDFIPFTSFVSKSVERSIRRLIGD